MIELQDLEDYKADDENPLGSIENGDDKCCSTDYIRVFVSLVDQFTKLQ